MSRTDCPHRSAGSRGIRHAACSLLAVAGLALSCAPAAFAQDAAVAAPAPINSGDTAWLLMSSALVLLMTPGLALFYGGMVRAKNVINMLMKSFVAMSVITILWVILGYSLAFAKGNPLLGGTEWLLLNGVGQAPDDFYATTVPHEVFMFYQLMFAIITPALISGAVAERMKFITYVVFISIWHLLVYVPLAHMVWAEGGYLATLGALDFAGGTVVHISSGVSALVLVLLMGKRRVVDGTGPHNIPMTLIGTGLLWFGWFGFNAGSAVASNGLAANAFLVTHVAAAAAGLTWLVIDQIVHKKPTALGFASGAVAGLVAITPASGFVNATSAIAIGVGVSIISYLAIKAKEKLGYDDTLDVFAVHGVGGIWGAIATGLFTQSSINSILTPAGAPAINGLFYGGGFELLGKQLIAIGITVAIAAIGTAIIGSILKATMGLSVTPEEEALGLDSSLHGEEGYQGPSTGSFLGIDMAPHDARSTASSTLPVAGVGGLPL